MPQMPPMPWHIARYCPLAEFVTLIAAAANPLARFHARALNPHDSATAIR
jgi:hypothetical protein